MKMFLSLFALEGILFWPNNKMKIHEQKSLENGRLSVVS